MSDLLHLAGLELELPQHVRERNGIGTVLLVGEAPTERGDPEQPLIGPSGRRLARLAGVTYPNGFLRAFDRVNVVPHFPGYARESTTVVWPRGVAAGRGRRILEATDGRYVLLLGRRVAAAMGFPQARFLKIWHVGESVLGLLPHPSGLSRWWNDEANVRRAQRFVRSFLKASRRHVT